MDTYRVLFSPDGRTWINSKDNDYLQNRVVNAIMDARAFCMSNILGKAKVINTETKQVIWDSEEEVKNHPNCWIAQARASK